MKEKYFFVSWIEWKKWHICAVVAVVVHVIREWHYTLYGSNSHHHDSGNSTIKSTDGGYELF